MHVVKCNISLTVLSSVCRNTNSASNQTNTKKGAEAAKVNATQRSCAKCRAAGRQAQALGHKGGNCPCLRNHLCTKSWKLSLLTKSFMHEIIYVSDDDAAIE
jgi:hypothetical protein